MSLPDNYSDRCCVRNVLEQRGEAAVKDLQILCFGINACVVGVLRQNQKNMGFNMDVLLL
jgi:hypothetical protein